MQTYDHVRAYVQHMKRRGFTAGTISGRDSALRSFARWLEPRDLFDASSEDIDLFLDSRRARDHDGPISNRTRYGWVSALHKFYQWAVLHDLTGRDPTIRIERPRLHKKFPRPISEGDLAMALASANRQTYAWLMLAAYAGFRCLEIGRMEVDWFLREEQAFRVFGKGDKERFVPAHPKVVDALDQWGLPKRGYVFIRPRGGPYPAAHVSRDGNAYLAGLGIPATMHMCRHRFGTQFYKATRDLRLTQEVMGHSDPVTTAGYVAVANAEARVGILALPTFDDEAVRLR